MEEKEKHKKRHKRSREREKNMEEERTKKHHKKSRKREKKMEVERHINHYSSSHKILLVGEGDFSFSVCLANAFQSARNMVATSLDTQDAVVSKFADGGANLEVLRVLGCTILHEVNVHTMARHPHLNNVKFDMIVFNFPHAGFHYPRHYEKHEVQLHQKLIRGFLMSAREMLTDTGEVHVTHKFVYPFSQWKIGKLGEEVGLCMFDKPWFMQSEYPGYNDKMGDGPQCDLSLPIGNCCTFKFSLFTSPKLQHLQFFESLSIR